VPFAGKKSLNDLSAEGLSREIRKWDLVALLVNVTVGAGIFKLPADVQKAVGNYSLAAFVACAVIIGLIALCFAEVASRFSGTGGPYLYAKETFGSPVAFLVGWLMWLTRLAGFAMLLLLIVLPRLLLAACRIRTAQDRDHHWVGACSHCH
jgi:basic amino acid/polyamine antiporter, APA family